MSLQRAWNPRTSHWDGPLEEREEVIPKPLTRLCCGNRYRARLIRDGRVIAMKDVDSAHEGAQWLHQFSSTGPAPDRAIGLHPVLLAGRNPTAGGASTTSEKAR